MITFDFETEDKESPGFFFVPGWVGCMVCKQAALHESSTPGEETRIEVDAEGRPFAFMVCRGYGCTAKGWGQRVYLPKVPK